MKLTIELVPKTSWYSNVRSNVPKETWDRIRRDCYKKADYKCEICGGVGDRHPVECHEIWKYDDDNHTQILAGLIALCPNCHKTKHPGLAKINGEFHIVIDQLMSVNGMSEDQAMEYISDSFDVWKKRSRHEWTVDISAILHYLKHKQ